MLFEFFVSFVIILILMRKYELKLFFKVEGLRDEADKAKRECLEVKKIAEEKEVLFKQEQAALRKVS